MKTYRINGVEFSYDETQQYLDFYLQEGKRVLAEVQFDVIFQSLQDGKFTVAEYQEEFILLDRWIREAPRKRFYRNTLKAGIAMLSMGEYFFDDMPDEEAEEIFRKLELSGQVARRFLEAYLPDLAEQCKQRRHPAEKHYIGPVEP